MRGLSISAGMGGNASDPRARRPADRHRRAGPDRPADRGDRPASIPTALAAAPDAWGWTLIVVIASLLALAGQLAADPARARAVRDRRRGDRPRAPADAGLPALGNPHHRRLFLLAIPFAVALSAIGVPLDSKTVPVTPGSFVILILFVALVVLSGGADADVGAGGERGSRRTDRHHPAQLVAHVGSLVAFVRLRCPVLHRRDRPAARGQRGGRSGRRAVSRQRSSRCRRARCWWRWSRRSRTPS